MNQFQVSIDTDGDLTMAMGYVVPLRNGQAPVAVNQESTTVLFPDPVDPQGGRTFGPSSAIMTGGSGRNVRLQYPTAVSGTLAPVGVFKAYDVANFQNALFPDALVTYNGDDSVDFSDGTNILASAPAGTLTTTGVPTAPFTLSSTSYGDTTYNGGAPFTVDGYGEDTPANFVFPDLQVYANEGTALSDKFIASDADHYAADTDPTWVLVVNNDGSADISDATDIVASRAAGNLHDAAGQYVATDPYGITTYNGGEPFQMVAYKIPAQPIQGYVWIEITEPTPGGTITVSRPFWGIAVPAPTSTVFPITIAYADGAGNVEQFQQGPIFWT